MLPNAPAGSRPSPMRALEMLSDRFGAFEAIANSTIKLARHVPEDELSMDTLVAEALLEFGTDLRTASADSMDWARRNGLAPDQVQP